MRHKNRAKYIENFHLCKQKSRAKKKIENEQKEGNIDERQAKI